VLTPRQRAALRRRLLRWYRAHRRALPFRGSRDPYRIWLSEVMLQQTRVAAALPYYRRFLRRFPSVRALARAREQEVLRLWAGLGYYSRARNLRRAAKIIVARHGGKFPRALEEALALPGVGRYTAAAVLSIAYGQPLAVLDGNVARVLARIGAVRGDSRAPQMWRGLERQAQELIPVAPAFSRMMNKARLLSSRVRRGGRGICLSQRPQKKADSSSPSAPRNDRAEPAALKGSATKPGGTIPGGTKPGTNAGEWNQALMELGALVCTPRAPRCGECPVANFCRARKLGVQEEIPRRRKKRATRRVRIAAAVLLDRQGRTLLLRPQAARNGDLFSGMWQFPAVEARGASSADLLAVIKRLEEEDLTQRKQRKAEGAEKNRVQRTLQALPAARHTVTFREIELRPYLLRVERLPRVAGARAVALRAIASLPVSSATRKIAHAACDALNP
jgi:A/G-specific adenine glycosylase